MSRPADPLRVGALVVAGLFACACRDAPTAPASTDAAPSASSAPAAEAGQPADAGAPTPDAGVAFDEAPFVDAHARSGKSIGHTSVVLKLELSTGKKAAFKPNTRRGPGRYKGEIAAHRLARALGLSNVPLALARSFARGELEGAVGGSATEAGKLLAAEVVTDGALVHGALMPWIDRLEFVPLEAEPLLGAWRGWVRRDHAFAPADAGALGALDEAAQRALATQVSTLVLFDAVTGNWDRWSGGNVGYDRASRTLLFLDNDGAFFETPPKDALARNQRLLERTERFSRSFVARLRALDEAALARAVGEERPGVPLLSAKVLAAVSARRNAALADVDAKIGKYGEDATLAFP